jgi:hypothetical protein
MKSLACVYSLQASGLSGTTERVPSRFEGMYRWADATRNFRHNSLQTAHENAILLMQWQQSSLVLVPTTFNCPIRHDCLVESSDPYRTPLNFASTASYQIQEGQLEQFTERNSGPRHVISHLTVTDQLRVADPLLAERSTESAWNSITSAPSNGNVGMNDTDPVLLCQRHSTRTSEEARRALSSEPYHNLQ